MSKAKLIITAVTVQGLSLSEAAAKYGASKGWASKLMARWREEGEAAFEPRSRRPRSSPNATDEATVALIVRLRGELARQGLDAGPTSPCPTARPRPPVTRPSRKPAQRGTAPPTPTTGSATTRSTRPAKSPSATPASSTTSASSGPTPEPPSPSSSKTSTSPSSTPPPAKSHANSSSTPPGPTTPPAKHETSEPTA
ncbi:MAG: helix-turn-helix domain-containing protein [Propionibacteriaceae bacterium]|nr:helix-turn-helix domain-containing protein [Propionibacteriaceae bacterium]